MTTATATHPDVLELSSSGTAVGWALGLCLDATLTPNERWVLVAASAGADEEAKVRRSVRELTATTGLGKSTVYRAFSRFRELGLVTDDEDDRGRFLRFGNNRGSSR